LKRCCDDQTLPPNDDLRELARTDFANPHQADDLSREKGLNGRLGAQSDDLREGSDGGGGSRSAPSILLFCNPCVFVFVFVGFPDLRTEIYRFKNGPNPNAWAVWLLASSSHVMAE